MDYLSSIGRLFSSKEYEDIYIDISKKHGIKYHSLFIVLACIGFRRGKKISFDKKGREFRLSYLDKNDKTILYTILLEDRDLDIEIEDLTDENRFGDFKKTLEEYAQGGMEILLDEVFPPGIEKNTEAKTYDDYIVDIMSFIYKESIALPF